jgi:hypothetical protein
MLSIDADVLRAAYDYSRDSGERLDDIYDQALRDYLKKKGPASRSQGSLRAKCTANTGQRSGRRHEEAPLTSEE